jgi:outer membrane biosynthesis protein TonB
MPVKPDLEQANFGLLPEPERSPGSFITSTVINGLILAFAFYIGMTAKKAIDQHRYEETLLILPTKPPPPPPKVKMPPPPPIEEVKVPEIQFEAPKINIPKPEPKPDLKPIVAEVKLPAPIFKNEKPNVVEAPQPKSALAPAAMPAQDNSRKVSTAPVHLGQTFGVTPNPNARGPATVAAIGNEYGGRRGPVGAPHGVPGSTGIGDGTKFGNNNGRPGGKVAAAAVPQATAAAPTGNTGKVASAGVPTAPTAVVAVSRPVAGPLSTNLVVISKPVPEYTTEAKSLKVQGDVILRVTFTAGGQVVVQGVVHGLGHGLDDAARCGADSIPPGHAQRTGGGHDNQHHDHVSIGVTSGMHARTLAALSRGMPEWRRRPEEDLKELSLGA